MSFSEMLNKLMEDNGTSNVALGKAVGVSDMAVARWRKKETVPSLDNAIGVASYYGISLDELAEIQQNVITTKYLTLPVIGSVSVWGVYTHLLWASDYIEVERASLHDYPQEECFALVVRDGSLSPDYAKDISYLIFHQQQQCENNDYVVIRDKKSNELMFKNFNWTDNGIHLCAPNVKPIIYRKQDINKLEILAVMIDAHNDI